MWIILKEGQSEGPDGEYERYASGAIGPFVSEAEAQRFIDEKLTTKDAPWGASYSVDELDAPEWDKRYYLGHALSV